MHSCPQQFFSHSSCFCSCPKFPSWVACLNIHECGLVGSAVQCSVSSCPPVRHMSWGSEVWSRGLCGARCLLVLLAAGSSLRNPGQSQPRRRWSERSGTTPTVTLHSPVFPNMDMGGGHLSCIPMCASNLDGTAAPCSLGQNGRTSQQEDLHWLSLDLHWDT